MRKVFPPDSSISGCQADNFGSAYSNPDGDSSLSIASFVWRTKFSEFYWHPNNAYVEAINGLLQQAKRAARGYRNVHTFIAIAYLRMSKLKHLPESPFTPAKPYGLGRTVHYCT